MASTTVVPAGMVPVAITRTALSLVILFPEQFELVSPSGLFILVFARAGSLVGGAVAVV